METTNLRSIMELTNDRPLRDPWDSLSWWRREEEAKQRELSHNLAHPSHPIRIEVIDTLASNQTIDKIFNIGLLIIPSLFIISAIIWCLSRLTIRLTIIREYLELISLIIVSLAVISFIIFGFIFLIGMCSGYNFKYHLIDITENNTNSNTNTNTNTNSYHKSYFLDSI